MHPPESKRVHFSPYVTTPRAQSLPPIGQLVSQTRSRVMHFKTSNSFQAGAAWDGSLVGNSVGYWTSGYTALSGHTAYLPGTTTEAISGTDGFWNFPFFKSGTYHWAIRGGGSRFACDDFPNGYQHTTLHQVWVRMAQGTTAAPLLEEPTLNTFLLNLAPSRNSLARTNRNTDMFPPSLRYE